MAQDKIQVSETEFNQLLKKANLTLTSQENTQIHSQLNEAIDAIKVFDELDLKDVPALNQPIEDAHNTWREDVVEASLSQAEALSQSQSTHQGYFMVKAIFQNEDN